MKHPIQPVITDDHNIVRFKANPIVQFLLNTHPSVNMKRLATMNFSDEDRQQFAQLTGYSLSGYGELPYVDDVAWTEAQLVQTQSDPKHKGLMNWAHLRIMVLEKQIAQMQENIDALREPMARLLGKHPDDLKD